jgi:hypothetical protein
MVSSSNDTNEDAIKGFSCGVLFGTPILYALGRSGIREFSLYRNKKVLFVGAIAHGLVGAYFGVLTGF